MTEAEAYKKLLLTLAETMEEDRVLLRTAKNIRKAVAAIESDYKP